MDRKRALKSCLLFPWAGTSRLMTGGNYYIRQEIVEEGGRPKGGIRAPRVLVLWRAVVQLGSLFRP